MQIYDFENQSRIIKSPQVVFETFGFDSYMRRPAPWFSGYEYFSSDGLNSGAALPACAGCGIVVDSGFSASICMPLCGMQGVQSAVKRLAVGGKFLTNYLKEMISFRQWNMMDDFLLINRV